MCRVLHFLNFCFFNLLIRKRDTYFIKYTPEDCLFGAFREFELGFNFKFLIHMVESLWRCIYTDLTKRILYKAFLQNSESCIIDLNL